MGDIQSQRMILAHASVGSDALVVATVITAAGSMAAAVAAALAAKANFQLAEKTGESVTLAQKELQQGERQLQQAQLSLEATYRPLIVGVPHRVLPDRHEIVSGIQVVTHEVEGLVSFDLMGTFGEGGGQSMEIVVPIRNIGSGPAMMQNPIFVAQGEEEEGWLDDIVVAPNEKSVVGLNKNERQGNFVNFRTVKVGGLDLTVKVRYTDLSAKKPMVTTLTIGFDEPNDRWYVKSLGLDDDPTPRS